ncbi:cytidylyltransferase domain-containing protein [Chloroflexota bacterium]
MRVGIILQARMGSNRLPGKVLKDLEGKSMLWHIIERLKVIRQSDELVVATSNNAEDGRIVELAESCGVGYFIGSEQDVLDRFYQAAKEFQLEQIIRATGDNPLIDPEEADRLIGFHLETAADYSSNMTGVNSGLPVGVGVEVFSFTALQKSWLEGKNEDHREHVDEYILQNPDKFSIEVLHAPESKQAPNLRLTVDTQEDFNFMRDIYRSFYVSGRLVPVEQVIRSLVSANQGGNR